MEVPGRRNERSFRESVENSSAEADEVFCKPCSTDGKWLVAVGYCQNCNEFFCTSCLKYHRNLTATRHHVILEGENMLGSRVSQIHIDPCSEPCVQHKNEIVKYYCSSHDAVGCVDCLVLSHRACKTYRIQDVSIYFVDSQEHRELGEKIEKFINDLDMLEDEVQRSERFMNESCNKAVNDIKAFRKEVNDYLDNAEDKILTDMNERKQMEEKIMTKLKADKQLLQNDIKKLQKKLNKQSNKANDLFVAAIKMKERMSSLDVGLEQMFKNCKVKQYHFMPSPVVRRIIASQVPFGKLTENILSQKIENMVPQYEGEINVRTPEETKPCFFIASAIISPTQIVLVDYNNKSAKLVDIQQKTVLARHGFKKYPTDFVRINENTIAVAFEQKIQYLSITQNDNFTKGQELEVNCSCDKLFLERDQIFVAGTRKIGILDTRDSVVIDFNFPDIERPICIVPADDSKSFYVAYREVAGRPTAVYKFNYDGSMVAAYRDRNLPDVQGLTVTKDGTVLVCNYSDPGSIHMMTPECKKIKEILQDNEHVKKPYWLAFCDETNKLFICNNLGSGINDVLKVFLMKRK